MSDQSDPASIGTVIVTMPPPNPDAMPEYIRPRINPSEVARAAARLELSQLRDATRVKARRPRPRATAGTLGVHKNVRQPRPVETPDGYKDRRLAGALQSISLLHAAGVQRPTVELNAMRPLAVLRPESGHWNLLQFACAYADAATPVVISALPAYGANQMISGKFDPTCIAEPIEDGAIAARGRLILRNNFEDRTRVQITSTNSSRQIFWQGQGYNPSAPGWTIDLAPHSINGELVEHLYFDAPPRATLSVPRETWVEAGRIAMFDVLLIRAAASATTFVYISRMI